ncbi:MAG: SDR family oxidoreductase, partial [Polynucleobacter victoriensis]
MGFLAGKKIVLTGLLSNRSIAYGIAKACHREGAELAFTYVGERFKDRITEFAAEFDSKLIFDCDVGSDEQIDKLFADLSATWPKFDGLIHSIGFAPREAIAGDFLDGLSRESFKIAHDISAYSFPAMAKAALPMLNDKSALLTLTYLGSQMVVPNYNTMGLAKASLEASVQVEVLGHSWAKMTPKERSQLRASFQVIFQDPFGSLSPRMTVGQIIGEGLALHQPTLSQDGRKARVIEVLKEVG